MQGFSYGYFCNPFISLVNIDDLRSQRRLSKNVHSAIRGVMDYALGL
jgi:hypothetical protein